MDTPYQQYARFGYMKLGKIKDEKNRWDWAYMFARYAISKQPRFSIQAATRLWKEWTGGFGGKYWWLV